MVVHCLGVVRKKEHGFATTEATAIEDNDSRGYCYIVLHARMYTQAYSEDEMNEANSMAVVAKNGARPLVP